MYFDINKFITDRSVTANISCKTLLVTVFGDVVSQHGKWIWLGSLINALKPLGYSERLVRTSVNRLLKEDWLQYKTQGRKSFYSFTDTAELHFTKASRRIYATDVASSKDQWLMVFCSFVDDKILPEFKKQLSWLGFSALSSGVYAHPDCSEESLYETIEELKLSESVIVFNSHTQTKASAQVLKRLVYKKWDLAKLQKKYQELLLIYKPLLTYKKLTEEQCFALRILLIHEYRRILLNDHELSKEMLPQGWQGPDANQLVQKLYAIFNKPSLGYIKKHLESFDGYVGDPCSEFSRRFHKTARLNES